MNKIHEIPEIQTRIHNNKIQVAIPKTEKELSKSLYDEFSVQVPGYQFQIRYRMGKTDGKHKFFKLMNLQNHLLFEFEMGFIDRLKKFNLNIGKVQAYSRTEILDFLKKEIPMLPFKPRKYQLKMILGMLQSERHLGILSTGGGKSLVAYLVIKFLLEQKNKKIILIVPTIGLVDQMYSDFKDYGAPAEFLNNIQLIGGEYKNKYLQKSVVVSTWQSLSKSKNIKDYDCLFVDEAHKAKADVLSDILKTNIPKKIGMTGSMPIIELDAMKLEEIFSSPVIYATAKDLIDLGLLTKTVIIAMFLNYPRKYTSSGLKYQQESKLIRELPQRISWTVDLLKKVKKSGITIMTYNTTKFGESIYNEIAGINSKKIQNDFQKQKELGVFIISGKTKSSIREQIRLYLNSDESSNEIVIAQTTTMELGINIPKLKNFVFGEAPGKSFTKILQSIGRVMRKAKESGNSVYVWDIVDCFSYKNENYTQKHFWERLQYYEAEGHPIVEKEVKLG
jgi:superfamily II DNA or RNA helicase